VDPISALADLVEAKLAVLKQLSPGIEIIKDVLQVVYTTSMKKEESEPLRCAVVYMDPKTKNDGTSPSTDCWNSFPLAQPIPYDARNLGKISRSADPAAIVVAVFPDSTGKLQIWGLIDQVAVHGNRLASWETWVAEGTPGSFHVTVNGVADLTVFRGLGIIGALKQDTVVRKYDDVMNTGPVADHLHDLASPLAPAVARRFGKLDLEDVRSALTMHLSSSLANPLAHAKI